ncbi:TIR domain-containing protein [Pontibacter sp. 13R65]|uniref:TIR domain-containing protein n=1 Tax=Pontibacter sp. 13R65 TaxID=3127458 RepID=UPI00301BAE43
MPFPYDVFISYRWITPDQEWVREQLYPALINAGLKVCLDVEDFVPGRDLMLEMERAGTESRQIICIISPEYFEEGRMVEFESLSARRRDPGGRNSTLIPFLLRETTLPERIRGLIPINWTNQKDQAREWRKLLTTLGATNINVTPPGAIQPKDDSNTIERFKNEDEPEDLEDEDWEFLLDRINEQSCTPIIGPGIYSETFPYTGLVQEWSGSPEYPFADLRSLTLAAQFRSLTWGSIEPKSKIVKRLGELAAPNFTNPDEPHRILASLPLPYYITTNYDDFVFKALQFCNKQPRRDLCRWDDPLRCEELSIFNTGFQPDIANPVVFHLYGYSINKRALVVTEDDYLDFLVNVSKYPGLIPPMVQQSLTDASILLLGYRFDDWDFRILFRTLVNYLKISPYKVHLSVQLTPIGDEATLEQKRKAKNYFGRYLKNHNIRVSWKTCQEFIAELKKRWQDSGYGK